MINPINISRPISNFLVEEDYYSRKNLGKIEREVVRLAYFLRLILDYQLFSILRIILSSQEAFTVSSKRR